MEDTTCPAKAQGNQKKKKIYSSHLDVVIDVHGSLLLNHSSLSFMFCEKTYNSDSTYLMLWAGLRVTFLYDP